MQSKDINTADTLHAEDRHKFKYMKLFNKQMTEQEILTQLLKHTDVEDQRIKNQLGKMMVDIQEEIQEFQAIKRDTYQVYEAGPRITMCVEQFLGSQIGQGSNQEKVDSCILHNKYIDSLNETADNLLTKISKWRNEKKHIQSVAVRLSNINLLNFKKYNVQYYLQQLLLIKDLVQRVKAKLAEQVPDFQFVAELASKDLVPYTFYREYCLNNCCQVINKRIIGQELIILKQNAMTIELLKHMKQNCFKVQNLYQKCQHFLLLAKYIRVTNRNNISVQNGFIHLFKSFFIDLLCEQNEVDCTYFLKARSIMQCNSQAIDIWHQFQEIKVQMYVIWYYQQLQWLKNIELVQLIKVRQICNVFKQKYEWIGLMGIKSIRIQGVHDFIEDFMKLIVLKILRPILTKLYVGAIPKQKLKQMEKYAKQFNLYWTYTIFGKYPHLYKFIHPKLTEFINSISSKLKTQLPEQDIQLNPDQYYQYYRQLPEIIKEGHKQVYQLIAQQFNQLWCQISALYCFSCSDGSMFKYTSQQINEELQQLSYVVQQQLKLSEILLMNKKLTNRSETQQKIYSLVMNLNFVSQKYFLIRNSLKIIDKSTQKQIQSIRSMAYHQFFP